ncbi:helix-turn-helix transcriptional regulator [Streptomyces sp. NPDC059456]|uniref:helix-turn-helix transcriptional regulator n=1 Tax=Streptomyces sp. NPDC059456 TaxID=3346838 RepID=UPI003676362C
MSTPFRVTDATLDVIEVLLTGEPDLYGLRIAKEISRASGSVVPILMRLEDCGWVTSQWETSTPDSRGPRRRLYQLQANHVVDARKLIASRRKLAPNRAGFLRPGLEGC